MAGKKKRSPGWKIILFVTIAAVAVLLTFVGYEWWLERKSRFVKYSAFGIEIPINYSIHGIDVSKYQRVIHWPSVSEMEVMDIRISFAFMKATEGLNNEDAYFNRNWRKSKEANLVRGAYHFFLATKSGKKQAENFIRKVELEPGDLPPVLDIEQTYGVSPDKLRERAKEWLETVESYYGVKPIIYTSADFYRSYLKDDFDSYPLWVAHYLQRERPRIHRDWSFWQHNETGRINGIPGYVDFNVFNGDSTAFSGLLIPGR